MLSERYLNLLRVFGDPNQGASAGQQMPVPQQDPNQQQQMQNNQGQPQGQSDPNQQVPLQGDPNQQSQQPQDQMQAQAQQDHITNEVMQKVAAGTVYLMARNMAIKKGFQPGTPEYYRYIGEAIEVGSGCAN